MYPPTEGIYKVSGKELCENQGMFTQENVVTLDCPSFMKVACSASFFCLFSLFAVVLCLRRQVLNFNFWPL